VVTKSNVEGLGELRRILEGLGVKHYLSPVVVPCRDGCSTGLSPGREELEQLIERFPEVLGNTEPRKVVYPLCGVGDGFYLAYNGDVKRCMEHPDVLGNVYRDGIENIFNSREFHEAVEIANKPPSEKCRNCHLKQYCFPCPALVGRYMAEGWADIFCVLSEMRKEKDRDAV